MGVHVYYYIHCTCTGVQIALLCTKMPKWGLLFKILTEPRLCSQIRVVHEAFGGIIWSFFIFGVQSSVNVLV